MTHSNHAVGTWLKFDCGRLAVGSTRQACIPSNGHYISLNWQQSCVGGQLAGWAFHGLARGGFVVSSRRLDKRLVAKQ